jgi:N4-gp56 family major capsid protein
MQTEFATGATEAVRRWSSKVWAEMPRTIFWGRFMSDSDQAIIQTKRDLEGVPGETLTFTFSKKLSGAGVAGDDDLEGQEEELQYFSDSVTLQQRRNAVRLKGQLSEKRTAFDQRKDAQSHLKTWLAETIDDYLFTQFDTNPTTVLYGGDAVSTATIEAGDLLTPTLFDRAVAKAKKADPKIWPVSLNGKDHYVVVMHTDSGYDLQRNSEWNQTTRDAGPRGDGNNIFTGAFGEWRGVVLHEHEKVPVSTTYGALGNIAGASNFFLGMQAGLFAWGKKPEAWTKEFQYGASVGFAIGAIWDFSKAVFDNTDHAFIALRTSRTNN